MTIDSLIKTKILQIVNVFETGTPEGRYDLLVVMADGRNRELQITFGRSQTTEQGNLKRLVKMYVDSGGIYALRLFPYLIHIGKEPLYDDTAFKKLLVDAARLDPLMREAQDLFFDESYFLPALKFCETNGFEKGLSLLVIYDSYVHSGQVPMFLRRRFGEYVPAQGGREKEWIGRYVDVRNQWLKYHSNELLRKTIYRTLCFKEQLANNNWDLLQKVNANGVPV
ncbi:MAG: chitosanase [Bacteroidales bacterium]|nr:chitosanase [Bacteroidales bacterium]